jgi:hypothetical protein
MLLSLMLRLPGRIAQAIASLGLTTSTAARKIGGDMAGYKAAYKRLTRLTGPSPPETIALLEADLDALGLEITITPKPRP